MKGYAKIKENNPFSQRSKSRKEYPFLDLDFNHQHLDDSSNSDPKNPLENEQKPNIIIDHNNDKIKSDFSAVNREKFDEEEDRKRDAEMGSVLKRNFSVSSSKNGKLERQSSKRVVMQEAVKRAFSMRRCSSVNNTSERYSRICDQPRNVEHFGDCNYDYDDDFGSTEARSMAHKTEKKKKNVGSKVVKACKRLFTR